MKENNIKATAILVGWREKAYLGARIMGVAAAWPQVVIASPAMEAPLRQKQR